MSTARSDWYLACLAAAMIAVDPQGLRGIHVRARAGAARDRWLEQALALAPDRPQRRIAPGIADMRLTGGLDIGASLEAGRPVVETGVLATVDGGTLVVAMAERLPSSAAGIIGLALDRGEVAIERDGISTRMPARFAVLALDESDRDDEPLSGLMAERLGLRLTLDGIALRELAPSPYTPASIRDAQDLLSEIAVNEKTLEATCLLGLGLAGRSMRPTLFLLRAARAVAALHGRVTVATEDLALAARLVFGATGQPPVEEQVEHDTGNQPDPQDDRTPDAADGDDDAGEPPPAAETMAEAILEAIAASLPRDLLAGLGQGTAPQRGTGETGRAGVPKRKGIRGRAIGVTSTPPTPGSRLDVGSTLRAAAPWQRLRRAGAANPLGTRPRPLIRKEDFRYLRFQERSGTLAVFAVDASGSAAIERLAEAKGAVELLLAECYVRRDSVALVAFRGQKAETLLEPTRSLTRAKRCLSGLPGGGGTPLADGILATLSLASAAARKGQNAVAVFLTDGRGNIALDGSADRGRAAQDMERAALALKISRVRSMLIDTAQRPQPRAEALARQMGADYLALPRAGAASLAREIGARMEG